MILHWRSGSLAERGNHVGCVVPLVPCVVRLVPCVVQSEASMQPALPATCPTVVPGVSQGWRHNRRGGGLQAGMTMLLLHGDRNGMHKVT